MKIIEKLKSARGFLVRGFENKTKNIRWEARYKNLEKKYQEEKEEYENTIRGFEDKLNKDKNLSMIKFSELSSYIRQLDKENQALKKKYENAVADYETTMFEKEQLNSLVNSCQEEIRLLKKQLHEASLTIQEMTEQDIECSSNCENTCNDDYKNCWLKYFKKLQGSDSNEFY